MVDQISAVSGQLQVIPTAPVQNDSVGQTNNSQRVSSTNKVDKDPSTQRTTKTHEAYKVTLSKLAQVRSLKQTGTSVSMIAAKLGLTKADVDETLSITTDSTQAANAETVAALL
jgi:hypothetical protein